MSQGERELTFPSLRPYFSAEIEFKECVEEGVGD